MVAYHVAGGVVVGELRFARREEAWPVRVGAVLVAVVGTGVAEQVEAEDETAGEAASERRKEGCVSCRSR